MQYPSRFVLLFFVAGGALAASDPTPTLPGSNAEATRIVAINRPAATAPSFAALAVRLSPAGPAGVPLDCQPIAAYAGPPPGPRQTLAGQCFVVTDGGETIQLSRVSVRIYPQREFTWYAQEIEARSRARYDTVKAVACPRNFSELSLPEMDRSLQVAAELRRELHVVWQVLPEASASVLTDAAGRFTVAHEVAPPYVVFAAGSRIVGDETEYYRWQITSQVISDPQRVVLTNDTLR